MQLLNSERVTNLGETRNASKSDPHPEKSGLPGREDGKGHGDNLHGSVVRQDIRSGGGVRPTRKVRAELNSVID